MSKKARTPIAEYDNHFAIELPGDRPPQERDHLTDQAMVVVYDRVPGRQLRWRLRALEFDRKEWTRSGIRRWWAAHEVRFLATNELEQPIPEICRSYETPDPNLPAIFLCHRNTPMIPAGKQIKKLQGARHGPSKDA
jgi:hypothetical protein